LATTQANIKSIFGQAMALASPEERSQFLQQACAGDSALRAEVESLLRAEHDAGSFLRERDPCPTATVDASITECPGTVIGPYKLMEQIGEGGMGLVFVAEQQQPLRRKVALKVIKPGMDTRQVVARFEAERQALALMDHPNIAKVHDGGETASGRPYFVMELVKGVPITEHCDQNQAPIRERLKLFLDACAAVQHAHQKGIIHRDIKPSNVLVTSNDGTPLVKVIDFGIAKAVGQQLTDKTIYTQFTQLVGTPLYMSPEQAGQSGVDVDTRTDIYALGVLLYELLTGTTPFEKERFKQAAYDEIRRVIREEEPPKPSTRISTLGQAATTISTQRKTEPKQLSRLLRGELDWIVMRALEKDRNRRYEAASAFALDVQRYLADEPVQACPPSAGYRLRKFVRRNKARLGVGLFVLAVVFGLAGSAVWLTRQKAARQVETERAVTAALVQAETLLAEGDKQIERPERWQATARLAESALQKAEELQAAGIGTEALAARVGQVRAAVEAADSDSKLLVELERIRLQQSAVKNGHFDDAGAVPRYADVLRDYGVDLSAPEVAATRVRRSRLRTALLAALADWRWITPDATERRLLDEVLDAAEPEQNAWQRRWRTAVRKGDGAALVQLSESPEVRELPAAAFVNLARDLAGIHESAAAERLLRAGQERYPSDFWLNNNLGSMLQEQKNPPRAEEAVRYLTAALALRSDSPGVHLNLGNALLDKGDIEGAIRRYRTAIQIDSKYADPHNGLGLALEAKGDLDGAIEEFREALRLNKDYPMPHVNLGAALKAKGQTDDAIAEYRVALHINKDIPEAHSNLGAALIDKRELDGAIAECQEALRLWSDFPEGHVNFGTALAAKGRTDEAIAEYRKAIRLKKDDPVFHYNLANALMAKEQWDSAIAEYREAIALKANYVSAHANLANALMAKGCLAEAIAEHRKAIQLKGDLPLVQRAQLHWNYGGALAADGRLDEAVAEAREALRLNNDLPGAHAILATVLREKGDLDGALAECQEAIRLDKDDANAYCVMGDVLQRQGRLVESLRSFKKGHQLGSARKDWSEPSAEWVAHAERLVELDAKLDKMLGGDRVSNGPEAVALAWLCRQPDKRLYAAAARFYASAFAADPRLADDPLTGCRYKAACAAALAGCGHGKDAASLDDQERARLRRQALAWLQADLASWRLVLEKGPDNARPLVRRQMEHWQQDDELAAVRGTEALARLPEAERPDWEKLWQSVRALASRAAADPAPKRP
jgi:serine/threonine protein kinase/tetratricopeptide (TPR) repeat protein